MRSLIKLNKVIGYIYLPQKAIDWAIIYAKGGPSFGDNGDSQLETLVEKYNFALIIPDYIGHGRSFGSFSFKNCVNTLYECSDFFSGKNQGTLLNNNSVCNLKIKNIYLVGSSWGGAIVPFLERYRKTNISKICLIKPMTDWTTQAKSKFKEENLVETDKLIKNGWLNMYRGYLKSEWPEIFKGKLKNFNPIDNISLLNNKTLYIYHGKFDKSIHWTKSKKYVEVLKKQLNPKNIHFKLLNSDHSSKMTMLGFKEFLKAVSREP